MAAMPELPEVETTRRGLLPHVVGRSVRKVVLRRPDLRQPIPASLPKLLRGEVIHGMTRRAKYLLMDSDRGSALWHLGMSGSLRVLPAGTPLRAHDHVDVELDGIEGKPGHVLRFNDPRRFGLLLWQPAGTVHPLLQALGPEPLSGDFDGDHLFRVSRGRRAPVKAFLMDQAVVVGVGNIYAAEALFAAGIAPTREAGKVSLERYRRLADAVKVILAHAIERGGTTLRDFISPDGLPGYFEQELQVYGRGGEPCRVCGRRLREERIGQRASVWCPNCQK